MIGFEDFVVADAVQDAVELLGEIRLLVKPMSDKNRLILRIKNV